MEPSFFAYEQIAAVVVILLALAAAFLLVGNCVDKVRGWVSSHREKQQQQDDKIDFLKDQNTRHNSRYQDVVNLKRQVGKIEESVSKIDKTLDTFIQQQDRNMKELNEETALQTGAIKSLLDHAIDNNHNKDLEDERKKFDQFLIHRGR